ncbi:MAG: GNAT family N-acetyltransferase [Deltaproteobacteria bacterium]
MAARIAELADIPALVPVLARAFADDPFISWLVRTDAHRDAGFARFFELALRHLAIPFGEVYTNDERSGAALWVPPDKWRMGLAKQTRLVGHFAAICGWSRLAGVQLATRPMIKAHPREPHHYLLVVGVDPGVQGKGVGRELLAPMLALCDREQLPAYLETATERNLGLYQSLGFTVTGEHTIKNGPTMWFMWRAP